MAPLSTNFIKALEAPVSEWATVVELTLDDKIYKFGTQKMAPDIMPILKSAPSSLSSKIQLEYGKTSIGSTSFTIADPGIYVKMLSAQHIKNRRVVVKICPLNGSYEADAYTYFSGKVTDFKLRKNLLTITALDDLRDTSKQVPELKGNQAQVLRYGSPTEHANGNDATHCGLHPLIIMEDLLIRAGIDSTYIDVITFAGETTKKLTNWRFFRVLNKPISIKKLINEIQQESLSHIFQKGPQISVRIFFPPMPGDELLLIDGDEIRDSFGLTGCMEDNFYNRIVVYYDYDEEDYNSVLVFNDTVSQGATGWDEIRTKEITCRWIKTYGIFQNTTLDASGLVVMYASPENDLGDINVDFTYDGEDPLKPRVRFRASSAGTPGEWQSCAKRGIKTCYDGDSPAKYIKVLCDPSLYPSGDSTALKFEIGETFGARQARWLGKRYLNWFRNPMPVITFSIPLAKFAHEGDFITPAQIIEMTTKAGTMYGSDDFNSKRFILLSVKPNFGSYKGNIRAAVAALDNKYLIIAPNRLHQASWAAQSDADKEYGGLCGDDDLMLDDINVGFRIW